MKYLVFAVFADGHGEIATHSKEIRLTDNPEMEAEKVIKEITATGGSKEHLWEVFVFKSAIPSHEAPVQVAYWNIDDGLFGEQEG